jgi:sortase (surface protein transpeptidase)
MAKTIYRVDGASLGGPSPGSLPPAPKTKRRKLFWILLGIAIVAAAMIVAIAALGASESPAVGTAVDPGTSSTASYAVASTEPLGTSTTLATVPEVPSSTTTSSSSTSTTAFTHAIADPVRVVIPALKVDAKMVAVGLTSQSAMEVPVVGTVGWYKLGPVPGAAGPSVLVSHVSWGGKKGVFYYLKDLKPGDQVQVYDASGDCAVFQVDSSETILKTKLPTEKIWNHTDQAEIRLVTCGGTYNSKTGHFLSNVIVYGHLIK